jgi:deazaflavin-dependent oxidoreductase (nitroreductase family)
MDSWAGFPDRSATRQSVALVFRLVPWRSLENNAGVQFLRFPHIEESPMPQYIPSPRDWVREQVELYESSGGTKGTTLRDTGLPVIIVTNTGNKTGAIRKTPLMRVKDGASYVLVGSQGGAPTDPVWVHNLRAQPAVEIRDLTVVQPMRVREVKDEAERARLWAAAVAAFPPYAEYQKKTTRKIPVFIAEPAR